MDALLALAARGIGILIQSQSEAIKLGSGSSAS